MSVTAIGKGIVLIEPIDIGVGILPSGTCGVVRSVDYRAHHIVWSVPIPVLEEWGCAAPTPIMQVRFLHGAFELESVPVPKEHYPSSVVLILQAVPRGELTLLENKTIELLRGLASQEEGMVNDLL